MSIFEKRQFDHAEGEATVPIDLKGNLAFDRSVDKRYIEDANSRIDDINHVIEVQRSIVKEYEERKERGETKVNSSETEFNSEVQHPRLLMASSSYAAFAVSYSEHTLLPQYLHPI